jgi:hypothetical protein
VSLAVEMTKVIAQEVPVLLHNCHLRLLSPKRHQDWSLMSMLRSGPVLKGCSSSLDRMKSAVDDQEGEHCNWLRFNYGFFDTDHFFV